MMVVAALADFSARDSQISFSMIQWVVGFWRADHGRHDVELGRQLKEDGSSRSWIAWAMNSGVKCPLYVAGLIGPGDRKSVSQWRSGLRLAITTSCVVCCGWRLGRGASNALLSRRIGSLVAATPCW